MWLARFLSGLTLIQGHGLSPYSYVHEKPPALPDILMKPRCSDYAYVNMMYHTRTNATSEREQLREWVTTLNKKLCLWVQQQSSSADPRALSPCPVLVKAIFPVGRNVECGEQLRPNSRTGTMDRIPPIAYNPDALDGDGCHWDNQIVTEQLKRGDLIIGNYADQYRSLAVKSSLMYRVVGECESEWTNGLSELSASRPTLLPNDEIFRHIDFTYPRWFVKTDSDMIINIPAVFHYLKGWDAIELFHQNNLDIHQVQRELEARRNGAQQADAEIVDHGNQTQFGSLTPENMLSRSKGFNMWLGKLQREPGVKHDPRHKNREEVFIGDTYPPYTYGSFYALTDHALATVAESYALNRTAYSNEDTQLGIIVDLINQWPDEKKQQWDIEGSLSPHDETHIASILRYSQLQQACGFKYFLDPSAEAKLLKPVTRKGYKLAEGYAKRARRKDQKVVTSVAQCDCNRWLASFRTTGDDSIDMEDAIVNCNIEDHWLEALLKREDSKI